MQHQWDDTIVALATPPGVGAIGVIRLSGKGSVGVVDRLAPGKQLADAKGNSLHVAVLKEGDRLLDEVVISVFRGPRSYTGEDVVELSCHGSSYVIQQVVEACIRQGARMATPGEFTLRAFLNGKIDLVQAEAVADLIASGTQAAQTTALHQIKGGFSFVLKALREELIQFSALIELELDFSQEDVEFADRTSLRSLLNKIDVTVSDLLASFQLGNVIRNGVSVAIVGKPNAGKSTLLNALLNENRAIVSAIPGTTRDTIEEVLNIGGVLFRLIDTAGIREGADEIEAIGVERSREKMRSADIVLYLFDVNETDAAAIGLLQEELRAVSNAWLLVGNKVDLQNNLHHEAASKTVYISAKENRGLHQIGERLLQLVNAGTIQAEDTVVTNARHYASLLSVAESIASVKAGMDNRVSGDLLAIDIRRSLHHLGEITGEISNEDQLDYIFSKFCIGK
ncbi:MAG: tRNA uridine-5-carboxymethylaminomethyl(34) synthesis GTPase MnmE [Bacteroidetes bacterium]|nr:tRNA uridine-5-carboxymethylaminomethyl(34) synthesis GTPase MnmE [Bacteroidota bacterium]